MQLNYDQGQYLMACSDENAEIPERAGFYRVAEGLWGTRDVFTAKNLRHYATDGTAAQIARDLTDANRSIGNSKAHTMVDKLKAPVGYEYLPYQRAGIAYLIEKSGGLLADEMGLGKTIQAIGFINCVPNRIDSCLIVCPASLKVNWKRELTHWLCGKYSVGIASPKYYPLSDIVIINYDLLRKYKDKLAERYWDILIGDELHYCKNPGTIRSKSFYDIRAKYRIGITGTPIPNRVGEIYPILRWLRPGYFASRKAFIRRYRDNRGLAELQDTLRATCMVRRLKSDVIKELPRKRRQVLELPSTGIEHLVREELLAFRKKQLAISRLERARRKALEASDTSEYSLAAKKLAEAKMVMFSELSKERKKVAVAKIPLVIQHIKNSLLEERKVVVFCYHHEVIERIGEAFSGISVKHYGGIIKDSNRDANIQRFQTDKDIRVLIGSIKTATGYTATAASHAIFAELDWKPTDITQAEDRLHRIGQKDFVFCQHLVLEGSVDAIMAKKMVEKQEIIDKALDDDTPKQQNI